MPVNERLPAEKIFRISFPIDAARGPWLRDPQVAAAIVGESKRVRELGFMKSRENLVRLKRFQVSEKRRQLLQLEMMIAEFERMASELEVQIVAEEKKAGITDVNHFAYPTFAKAARTRQENLRNSRNDLAQQKSVAESLLAEAEAELSKAEMLESRDHKIRDGESDGRSAVNG
jgi:hypothetical protein